uniref:C-type mannose receptor 2-like n=1 Tax=Labrus bergylta TaxID=56723 RepID=A0A3Q3E3D8_9LABR|nr:C-type mannose receptor 2-like [Labrus bergylta]
MNTTTVKTALMMLVLCSGFLHFTFASQRLRSFRIFENEEIWSNSFTTCKSINASLVTLYDEEDARFTANFTEQAKDAEGRPNVWLGLHNRSFSQSNGGSASLKQRCGAIHNNNLECFDCRTNISLSSSIQSINDALAPLNKTWCQALKYCSQNHTDFNSSGAVDTSFWIALDTWEWQDNGCSSFRKWVKTGDNAGECTLVDINDTVGIYKYGCYSTAKPFCASGTVRIKVIQNPLTWVEAYDYCKENHYRLLWIRDEYDQWAVEQWLNYTAEEGDFWIGLRQSRVFGFWIWTSDTTVGFSKWKDGKTPQQSMFDHCGAFNNKDWDWNHFNCSKTLPFLCEENIEYIK